MSNLAVHLRTKSSLDDTLDVFPCHGVGGIVGMILTGVFADEGLAEGKSKLFISHMLALVIVSVFSFVGSLILYKITDLIIPLRVTDGAGTRRARPQPARRDRAGGRLPRRPRPAHQGLHPRADDRRDGLTRGNLTTT